MFDDAATYLIFTDHGGKWVIHDCTPNGKHWVTEGGKRGKHGFKLLICFCDILIAISKFGDIQFRH